MDNALSRREFLQTPTTGTLSVIAATSLPVIAEESKQRSLKRVIGITTGSLDYQRENRILTALTLPRFVRDELEMQLIDLNTRWLQSYDDRYVHRVRETAEAAECYFTNLKVNHKFGDLYDKDVTARNEAMAHARRMIEVARILGTRWVRFTVPKVSAADDPSKLVAHRELAAFAEQHGIQLLVENGGWLKSDPDSIVRVVKAIGRNVAACPDTGNWDDMVRFDGLKKSFPGAESCDFKVFDLDANRQHKRYDIRRCFEIGWQAGFRGPWAIEHWNDDNKAFARETTYLRDQLVKWMAAAE